MIIRGKNMIQQHLIKFMFLVLVVLCNVQAGTTGKIAGRILDGQTNEPLIAANVLLIPLNDAFIHIFLSCF